MGTQIKNKQTQTTNTKNTKMKAFSTILLITLLAFSSAMPLGNYNSTPCMQSLTKFVYDIKDMMHSGFTDAIVPGMRIAWKDWKEANQSCFQGKADLQTVLDEVLKLSDKVFVDKCKDERYAYYGTTKQFFTDLEADNV